jgi:hypothetical protein
MTGQVQAIWGQLLQGCALLPVLLPRDRGLTSQRSDLYRLASWAGHWIMGCSLDDGLIFWVTFPKRNKLREEHAMMCVER